MTSSTKATGSARRRARPRVLGLAIACALLAVAVAIPAASDAVRAKKLGHTKHTPRPACPVETSQHRCEAIGSVTGFQVKADGRKGLFRAPHDAKLVAWAVQLSKPTKNQRDFFGNLWHNNRFGKHPSARVSVIKGTGHHHYKLLKHSPPIDLAQSLGNIQYVTLKRPLGMKKGQILALTVPTWSSSFANSLKSRNQWRASRGPKSCPGTVPNAKHSKPQQKVGSIRNYACRYSGARLLYWGFYVLK